MPGARRFTEVRFDASGTVAARQTGAQAGSSVDAVVEPSGGGPLAGWRGVGIARNLPEAQLDQVLAGLEARFGATVQVITRGPGRCVFRYRLAASAVPDAAQGLLLTLGEGKGAPWIHVAGGEVMLRAEAGADPEGVVRTVRKALEVTGLSADVRGVELSGTELGPWLEVHGVLEALQEPGALDASRLPTTVTPGTP